MLQQLESMVSIESSNNVTSNIDTDAIEGDYKIVDSEDI